MRLCCFIVLVINLRRALLKLGAASRISANCINSLATIVLIIVFGSEIDWLEPNIRNSNLLPVKANGDVRFLSVVSLGKLGSTCTPISISSVSASLYSSPCSKASKIAVSSSPKYIDAIAGGASLAPRRWSLPGLATDTRSKSWCSSIALITATRNNKNWAFSLGVLPGSNKLIPVSVLSDQLLCLPLPFTPLNGFSWRRQTKLCLAATFFIISIVNWFWSEASLLLVKIGASSCWAGAASLCSVLANTPSFHNSSSNSFIKADTLGLIVPK